MRPRSTDGRPAVRFVRELSHPRDAVWRMVTDPAELAHWFPCEVQVGDYRGWLKRAEIWGVAADEAVN